jgi:hypothetical protein
MVPWALDIRIPERLDTGFLQYTVPRGIQNTGPEFSNNLNLLLLDFQKEGQLAGVSVGPNPHVQSIGRTIQAPAEEEIIGRIQIEAVDRIDPSFSILGILVRRTIDGNVLRNGIDHGLGDMKL